MAKSTKDELKFKIPRVKHEYPLTDGERRAYQIKDKPVPVDWAKQHWKLTNVYAQKGTFTPYKWQEFLINLILWVRTILTVAPVQSGKTMISAIRRNYCIDNFNMGGMVIFPTKELVETNFKLRIIPEIKEIPVMKKHWSGKDDDLTIKNMILTNGAIWGIASAQNKNDLATFGAQYIDADECSKWAKPRDFDPFGLSHGRQEAYERLGSWYFSANSSPFDVGDLYYNEIYKPGTLIVTPHVPCFHCSKLFEWSDYDIREPLAKDSKLRKDSNRIMRLQEEAVRYECPHCKGIITEEMRFQMNELVTWCAPKIEKKEFSQPFQVVYRDKEPEIDLSQYVVSPQWNRLIHPEFKFYRCLAKFFSSFSTPVKRKAYENEDMARFFQQKSSKKRDKEYFMRKCGGYLQYGPDACVPESVLVVVCCFDTQDNGLYNVIRGYGRNMETCLIRHDFIELPMDDKAVNKEECYQMLVKHLKDNPLKKRDGSPVKIVMGLIDQGGHRKKYVEHFCKKIPWLNSYVGNTRIDYRAPTIERREGKKFYYGQTELLSKMVEQRMESKNWRFPDDVGDIYLSQLVAQYWVTEYDDYGRPRQVHVKLPDDHLRDCENLCEGCVEVLDLEEKLFDDGEIKQIEEFNTEPTEEDLTEEQIEQEHRQNNELIDSHRRHNPADSEHRPKTWLSVIHNRRR